MTETPQHANPWTTLSTRRVYANPWIHVREDRVLNPSGGAGIYGVVEFQHRAVGVIPLDEERHTTWLVGQYRYTLRSYEWEIPGGGCPAGESAEACARRELEEETGLRATGITPLLRNLQLSNSTTDETADIFVATGLTRHRATPEETEALTVWQLPLEEAVAMAGDGRIRDVMSVVGLLHLGGLRTGA